jgi:hypothetical protein
VDWNNCTCACRLVAHWWCIDGIPYHVPNACGGGGAATPALGHRRRAQSPGGLPPPLTNELASLGKFSIPRPPRGCACKTFKLLRASYVHVWGRGQVGLTDRYERMSTQSSVNGFSPLPLGCALNPSPLTLQSLRPQTSSSSLNPQASNSGRPTCPQPLSSSARCSPTQCGMDSVRRGAAHRRACGLQAGVDQLMARHRRTVPSRCGACVLAHVTAPPSGLLNCGRSRGAACWSAFN